MCRRKNDLCIIFLGCLLLAFAQTASAANPKVAGVLESIDLVDYRGRQWTMDDIKQDKFLVVAFLGTECPLAKLYAIRLQELANEYSDSVRVLAVMSNRQDSLEEISAFAAATEAGLCHFERRWQPICRSGWAPSERQRSLSTIKIAV